MDHRDRRLRPRIRPLIEFVLRKVGFTGKSSLGQQARSGYLLSERTTTVHSGPQSQTLSHAYRGGEHVDRDWVELVEANDSKESIISDGRGIMITTDVAFSYAGPDRDNAATVADTAEKIKPGEVV